MRMKAKTGRCEGAKPYGTLPGEAPVIARMKALRASGLSWDGIANQLNPEGCQTRMAGKQWFGATVSRILNAQPEQKTKRA